MTRLRRWLCKMEWCKWTGPCTRQDWGARVFAFQCRSCKRFWMELYSVLVLLLAASAANAATLCSPSQQCYDCRLVEVNKSQIYVCPKWTPTERTAALCRKCAVGATGYLQCKYVPC